MRMRTSFYGELTLNKDMDNFKNSAKTKLISFGTFIYKKETGEILGRTCSGWGKSFNKI